MTGDQRPDLDQIEARFRAVLDGRSSRDAIDRWAARWVADDALSWDEVSWWALEKLHGIDLRHGPHQDFLHGDDQIRGWLVELHARRAADRDTGD
ncbi:hypothetical protein [Actinoalloteichus hymeniacidonis]|uniref:hypothetical protein n=1 Tax=Actinoalloteichus hymeniacidonis TaxID=340345 RepID=UPI000852A20D|nr:hypothetical protein [Actinoalloteichus hymeniacidonis]MBB5910782.1 hypothetical protein [Actinoalloteichus hymeniacidonis]